MAFSERVFQTASLCANAGNEVKMIGSEVSDAGEFIGPGWRRWTYMRFVGANPSLRAVVSTFSYNRTLPAGCSSKSRAPRVGRETQQDGPFILVFEEGAYAVFAHIGSDGDGIEPERFEECACIMRGGVCRYRRVFASAMVKCVFGI